MTWNEWGFRLPLCTYRLNWARRTSWGWLDEWNDTALQRENSKFELWRYEAKHATSHGGSPKYWIFTSERGRKNCFFETWKPEWGWTRDLSIFQAGSFNHFTTVPAYVFPAYMTELQELSSVVLLSDSSFFQIYKGSENNKQNTVAL